MIHDGVIIICGLTHLMPSVLHGCLVCGSGVFVVRQITLLLNQLYLGYRNDLAILQILLETIVILLALQLVLILLHIIRENYRQASEKE